MCEKTKEITNDTSGIILRTAMSAIPGLAPLASFWNELNSIKSTKRLNLLSNSIESLSSCYSKELDLIKDDISNHEKRITILETIAEKVVKEWNEEKIKLYAQIAINDFITLEPLDTKIAIINCFSELTMDDINLLKQMSMFEDTIQVIDLSKTLDTLIPTLCKLASRGLITETDQGKRLMYHSAANQRWDLQWKHKFYTVTRWGKMLLETINNIFDEQSKNSSRS